MPFIESFNEFERRMGCEHIGTNQRHLFANGGQSNGQYHQDPPTDPLALLPLKIEYLQAKLKSEEKGFAQCRDYITVQADYHKRGAGPAPAEEAFKDLERLQKSILALREEIQETQTNLARLRGPSQPSRYAASRAQTQATAEEAVTRAMAIEI